MKLLNEIVKMCLVKLGYSEKATKFENFFNLKFNISE